MHAKALSVFVSITLALGLCPGFAFADSLQALEAPEAFVAGSDPEAAMQPADAEPTSETATDASSDVQIIDVTPTPVAKRFNTMSVRVKHATVKRSLLKKGDVTIKNAVTVKNAQGALEFSKPSKRLAKGMSVNKKNGAITVKKGVKADTYAVLVKVYAKGDDTHRSMTKAALVHVTVK